MTGARAIDRLVDWDLAAATGARLAPAGPSVTPGEAAAVVSALRASALEAQEHVARISRLEAARGTEGVAVIDRAGWSKINVEAFREVLEPLAASLLARRSTPAQSLSAVGAAATGLETGALLGYLSTKVLGQYEAFGSGPGRLLLVAPNIMAAEQAMGVDPADFRLWVALHEETHRVQLTAVPWLREHLLGLVRELVDATELDLGELLARVRSAAGAVGDAVRGRDGLSLVEAVQSPEQRVIMAQVTAVMSLVEGHAEFVMDAAGPAVIPTVADIRARFERRRDTQNPLDRALRRLLGMDAKMRQYRDGRRFVGGVVDRVGVDGLNVVWTSTETLPTLAELAEPHDWVARVHG